MQSSDDPAVMLRQARSYASHQGWHGDEMEDFASEMVCLALAHSPEKQLSIQNIYRQALDRLHPPVRTEGGRRHRPTMATHDDVDDPETRLPHAPTVTADPWAPDMLQQLLSRLAPSDARLLRAYYLEQQTEEALAIRRGCTTSRVCQLLVHARQRLTYISHQLRRKEHHRGAC